MSKNKEKSTLIINDRVHYSPEQYVKEMKAGRSTMRKAMGITGGLSAGALAAGLITDNPALISGGIGGLGASAYVTGVHELATLGHMAHAKKQEGKYFRSGKLFGNWKTKEEWKNIH